MCLDKQWKATNYLRILSRPRFELGTFRMHIRSITDCKSLVGKSRKRNKQCHDFKENEDLISFFVSLGGVEASPLLLRPLMGLLYQPRMMMSVEQSVECLAWPSVLLSTTNPTWPGAGSNPGRRGGKLRLTARTTARYKTWALTQVFTTPKFYIEIIYFSSGLLIADNNFLQQHTRP
jgi:hypothetical protein